LEEEGAPLVVTLIKPSAIDTPYTRHAKNYLPVEPKNPPPVYAPETVAEAILYCAEHPEREVVVGGGGRALALANKLAPRATDLALEQTMVGLQQTDRPARPRHQHSLDRPSEDLAERGDYEGYVAESSLYTTARLNPLATGVVLLGLGLAGLALWRATRPRQEPFAEAPPRRPAPAGGDGVVEHKDEFPLLFLHTPAEQLGAAGPM
jgi:hypothetical protein